jgi:site-specific recombinase XerD
MRSVFRRVSRDGHCALSERLSDKHVAQLVKPTALDAGIRGDLPEGKRRRRFAGHSLRTGLATAAEVEERFVQRELGHASMEMTRRYQRRRGCSASI